MSAIIVGVDAGDFRLPVKDALRAAARLDFRAVEVGAAEGELAPENLSPSGRRHLARFAEGMGLQLAAVTADLPGLRLTDPRTVDQRVQRTLKVIELAKQVGVPIVASAAGALTHPETGEPSPVAIESLAQIGDFADKCGVAYAVRPAHDGWAQLAAVVDAVGCPAIKVCLDPAAMVMVGTSPVASLDRLIEAVRLLHVRDATAGTADHARGEFRIGHETPLGEGDTDLVGVLEALRDAEYRNPYILRRTDSLRPIDDLQVARDVLLRLIR